MAKTAVTQGFYSDDLLDDVPCRDSRTKDETGNRYGKLTVLRFAGSDPNNKAGGAMWLCRCACGNTRVARGGQLRQGKIVTCGDCSELPVGNSLLSKLSETGKPPCERGCPRWDDCLEQGLACSQFTYWTQWGGKVFPDPDKYPPTRQELLKSFSDDQQPNERTSG